MNYFQVPQAKSVSKIANIQVRKLKDIDNDQLQAKLTNADLIFNDQSNNKFERIQACLYQKKGRANSHFLGSGIFSMLRINNKVKNGINMETRHFGPKTKFSQTKECLEYHTGIEDCVFEKDPKDLFQAGEMESRYMLDAQIMTFKSRIVQNAKFYVVKDASFEVGNKDKDKKDVKKNIPDQLVSEVVGNTEDEMKYFTSQQRDLFVYQDNQSEEFSEQEQEKDPINAPPNVTNSDDKKDHDLNGDRSAEDIKKAQITYLKKVIQFF